MDEEGLRPELAWGWERHQSPGPQKARGGSCDEPPVPTLHPKLLAAVGQPPPPNAPRREGTPQQGEAQSQESSVCDAKQCHGGPSHQEAEITWPRVKTAADGRERRGSRMEPWSSLDGSPAEGGAGSRGKAASSFPLVVALLAPSGREPPRCTGTTGAVPKLPPHASPCHSRVSLGL